jgi:hypothetical protein
MVSTIVLVLPFARAFSYSVHRYLGNALDDFLKFQDPQLHTKLVRSIDGISLGEASIWADVVKRTSKWAWTRKYHYNNINDCAPPDLNQTNVGVLGVLQTGIPNPEKFTERERVMFVLHLLQDIHQPLHLSGRDRGGNSYGIIRNKKGRNKTTNLHSLWDSEIPWSLISEGYKLPDTIKDVELLDTVNSSLQANCDWIFPKNNEKYLVYEDYYDKSFVVSLFDNYLHYSHKYFSMYFG